jgi:small subunit ribosomal protein S21
MFRHVPRPLSAEFRRRALNNSIQSNFKKNGGRVVKLTVRDRESIQEAVRRFRKLVERSGIKKEMRRREYYEKPSEIRRRARLRAERRTRRVKPVGT